MSRERKTVWIVRDLEPIPSDPGNRRLMRAGMLATTLAGMGHRTRWITSSFDHYQKRLRSPGRQDITVGENLTITVLPGPGYRRNVGLARIRHNKSFASAFDAFATQSPERPDILVTDIPTTEAAETVVALGKARGIPTVLSIRDLWPDFFINLAPPMLRPLLRPLLHGWNRQVRFACSNATSLVGISRGYLDWGLAKAGRPRAANDRIFPLGYPLAHIPDAHRSATLLASLHVRPTAKLVAFVGSWGYTYSLEIVLTAARCLAHRDDVQFLIAGAGEQSERLLPLFAELPNVLVPGWIDAEQIAAVLSRTEVGLLPYQPDAPQGLPNKVFEYMAYGAYQVASIKGELDDFYSENGAGIALATADGNAYASAIEAALDDPGIAKRRQVRIDRFRARYAADVVYREFAAHIESLAGATAEPDEQAH